MEYGYEFKVIVTNKRTDPRNIIAFHDGHGSQAGIFTEFKTHCQMDYMPVRIRVGNQPYIFADILARNLTRKLQIQIGCCAIGKTPKRAALWRFREMETLRRILIRCTGRYPIGRKINPLHEQQRQLGKETQTCFHNAESHHLIDPSLHKFM